MVDRDRLILTMRRIEVAYGEDGWHGDEFVAPALFALFDSGRRSLGAAALLMPDANWEGRTPGQSLQHFARVVAEERSLMRPFRNPTWCGLALASEAWMAIGALEDEEQYASVMADADARQIFQRPDRINARFVMGITRDQERAFIWRAEGDNVEVMKDGPFPGGVVHGLAALVGAIDELLESEASC